MKCSNLAGHLYKLHIIDNPPACDCGYSVEDFNHYLLHCLLLVIPRAVRDHRLKNLNFELAFSTDITLYGTTDLSPDNNVKIALIVQNFIHNTARCN